MTTILTISPNENVGIHNAAIYAADLKQEVWKYFTVQTPLQGISTGQFGGR
jgi:hypothetical protein